MIILRQKQYADSDYAGLNMMQRILKRRSRNKEAARVTKARRTANATLQSNINSANRNAKTQLEMLENSDFAKSKRERELATKDILNKNQQDVNNAFAQRNQQFNKILGKADRKEKRIAEHYVKDRTPDYGVSEVTSTYKKAPQPQAQIPTASTTPQNNTVPNAVQPQKKGMGTMGKVAIGAGVAAAGYGAYRLLKARKQRKEAEEKEQQQSQGGY